MKTFSAALLALPASALAGVPLNSHNQAYNQAYNQALQCRDLAPGLAPRPANQVDQQLLSSRWWVGPGRASDGAVEVRQGAGLLSDLCALDHQQWFVFRHGVYEGALLPFPVSFEQAPRRARVEGATIVLEWLDEQDSVTRRVHYGRVDGHWQQTGAP